MRPAASSRLADVPLVVYLIEDREALRPLLVKLPPRERTILRLRFFHYLTQMQIAERVGMHICWLLYQTLTFRQQRLTHDTRSPCRSGRRWWSGAGRGT